MSKNTVGAIIAIVITLIWVISAIGSAFRKDYTALSIITPLMLTVAGWLFYTKKNGNGKKDGDK